MEVTNESFIYNITINSNNLCSLFCCSYMVGVVINNSNLFKYYYIHPDIPTEIAVPVSITALGSKFTDKLCLNLWRLNPDNTWGHYIGSTHVDLSYLEIWTKINQRTWQILYNPTSSKKYTTV